MPTILVVGPGEKEAIRAVIEHASEPKNFWCGKGLAPGEKPEHRVLLGTVRAVFSIDVLPHPNKHVPTGLVRHLTVSGVFTPPGKIINPVVAYEVAKEFGFTALDEHFPGTFPEDWSVQRVEGCVIAIAQALP